MALTDTRIRTHKPQERPVRLVDGEGLYLEVRPSGKKLWRYRYRLAGKENLYALGEYPDRAFPAGESAADAAQRRAAGQFTLFEARAERDRCRQLVMQGLHPAAQRRLAQLTVRHASAETFQAVATEWVADREPHWSPAYRQVVARSLEGELIPEFGAMPMRQITAAHLLGVLRRIDRRGARSVAVRTRFIASEIWRFGIATLRADTDIAAALRGAIKSAPPEHHPALTLQELPEFLRALDKYAGRPETIIAIRLMLMLFPRPGELIGARWTEMDLDGRLWRIPAERMKMREEHLVPLPTQAADLLEGLRTFTGHRPHVFPHRDKRDAPMTDNTFRQALHVMGYSRRLTPHGFRATAATALSEMGYRSELIDRQLSHAERNRVKAAYLRSPFLEERRAMLQHWADLVEDMARGGKVVVLRSGALPQTAVAEEARPSVNPARK